MISRQLISLLVTLLLCACQPHRSVEEISFIRTTYVDIPSSAQNIEIFRFSEGQWKAIYINFFITDGEFRKFIQHTCFVNPETFSDFKLIDYSSVDLPEWWAPDFANLFYEESCDQRGAGLGMAAEQHLDKTEVYLIIFVP